MGLRSKLVAAVAIGSLCLVATPVEANPLLLLLRLAVGAGARSTAVQVARGASVARMSRVVTTSEARTRALQTPRVAQEAGGAERLGRSAALRMAGQVGRTERDAGGQLELNVPRQHRYAIQERSEPVVDELGYDPASERGVQFEFGN